MATGLWGGVGAMPSFVERLDRAGADFAFEIFDRLPKSIGATT